MRRRHDMHRSLGPLLLAALVTVSCADGAHARGVGVTSESRPRPLPVGDPCVEPPQIQGDLRPLWTVSIEGLGGNTRLATDGQGNVFLAGQADETYGIWPAGTAEPSLGTREAFVVALDPDGHLLWKRSLPGRPIPLGLDVDRDGVVHVYTFDTAAAAGSRVSVSRFDVAGSPAGTTRLPDPVPFPARQFAVAPGGYVCADMETVRAFDVSGRQRWSRSGKTTSVEHLTVDRAGAVVVSGMATNAFDWVSPPLTAPGNGGFVIKLGDDGAVRAATLIPHELTQALTASGTRAFLATMPALNLGGVGGAFRLRVAALEDGDAATLKDTWSAGFETSDIVSMLAPAADGGLFAAGNLMLGAVDLGQGVLQSSGLLVARLDAAGRPVAGAVFHGARSESGSLAVDAMGNLIVAASVATPFDFGTGMVQSPRLSASGFAITKLSLQPAAVPTTRRCGPATPGAIFEGHSVDAPDELAVSETHLAAATYTDVMVAPITGGEPRYVTIAQGKIEGLALDAGNLYWAGRTARTAEVDEEDDGRIVALALQPGATPRVLVEHQAGLGPIAVDEHRLVFAVRPVSAGTSVTFGKLMSVPLEGGTPEVLVPNLLAVGPFALVGGDVVAAVSRDTSRTSHILRIAEDGAVTLLAFSEWQLTGLFVDGATIYWQEWSAEAGAWQIRSVPLAGGTPTLIARGVGRLASGLVGAGGRLAFAVREEGTTGLMEVPNAGGFASLSLSGFTVLSGLTARGDRLFWAQGEDRRWAVVSR